MSENHSKHDTHTHNKPHIHKPHTFLKLNGGLQKWNLGPQQHNDDKKRHIRQSSQNSHNYAKTPHSPVDLSLGLR